MAYKMLNGLRPGSSKSLMIGPGLLTKNFNLAQFDPTNPATWGVMLGATKGGNNVTMDTEWHQVEVDGALGPVDGMEWLTKAEAKVSTTLLEISKENLQMKLNVFDVTTHNTDYDIIRHNGSVAPIAGTNLALFGSVVGSLHPVVVVLENARCTDSFELPFGNGKDDVTLKAEFESRFSEAEPTKIPFYILYPKGGSPVAAPTVSPAPGTFPDAQTVEMTAASGTKIFYTLDGSYPGPLNGFEYSAAIEISETTTIKAVAVKDTDVSAPVSFTYTITA